MHTKMGAVFEVVIYPYNFSINRAYQDCCLYCTKSTKIVKDESDINAFYE